MRGAVFLWSGIVMISSGAHVPTAKHPSPGASSDGAPHFRAHGRRRITLPATLRGERPDWERAATIVDIHLAGAGVETEEALQAGERVSIAIATPTMWDPLVLAAVVVWAHPLASKNEVDALGRPRTRARAGLAFDYPTSDATLAMFEMLVAIGFE